MAKAAIEKEEDPLHKQNGLKFEEESSKMLHLVYSFLWC
jgi:hypothetical protein